MLGPEAEIRVRPFNIKKVLGAVKKAVPLKSGEEFIIERYALFEEKISLDQECLFSDLVKVPYKNKVQFLFLYPVFFKKKITEGHFKTWSKPVFFLPIYQDDFNYFLYRDVMLGEFQSGSVNLTLKIKKQQTEFLKRINYKK